jgi:hypothetical protein
MFSSRGGHVGCGSCLSSLQGAILDLTVTTTGVWLCGFHRYQESASCKQMLGQNHFVEPNWHVLTFLHPIFFCGATDIACRTARRPLTKRITTSELTIVYQLMGSLLRVTPSTLYYIHFIFFTLEEPALNEKIWKTKICNIFLPFNQSLRQPVPYPLLCGQSSFNSVLLFRPSDYLTLQRLLQIRPYEISGPHWRT